MEKTVKRILRSSDVEFKGYIHLDNPAPAHNVNRQQNINVSDAGVRILENSSDFALIEVTCSCGLKTQIKCQYASN
jgi:hypothetical protein